MPLSALILERINWPGSSSIGCTVTERTYLDFRIDGRSVLDILMTVDSGHSDYMTRFVTGFAQQGQAFVAALIRSNLPEGARTRVSFSSAQNAGTLDAELIL
jgi:hypothetical protein